MLHAVTVRPVQLRDRDEGLRCDRLHGIGFSWACSCGARGPIMQSHRAARNLGRLHAHADEDGTELLGLDRGDD